MLTFRGCSFVQCWHEIAERLLPNFKPDSWEVELTTKLEPNHEPATRLPFEQPFHATFAGFLMINLWICLVNSDKNNTSYIPMRKLPHPDEHPHHNNHENLCRNWGWVAFEGRIFRIPFLSNAAKPHPAWPINLDKLGTKRCTWESMCQFSFWYCLFYCDFLSLCRSNRRYFASKPLLCSFTSAKNVYVWV